MPNRLLLILLITAALLRIIGIGYGLPLWLVGDEPSFVFGSLKMMELRTLIPALHHSDFIGTFYYTPYLSYLYLFPFAVVAGVKYLFFSGGFAEFTRFLQTDLSHFFLAARLISAALGTATVYVMYRIGKNLFSREDAGLASAAFLGFSFLHVSFSHWARHWVPATFVLSLVLFFLSHPNWSIKKRYLLASLAAGIGMGVTQQVGLVTIFIALWFFLVDRKSLRVLREWWPSCCVGAFLALTALAYVLWPPGFYVVAGARESIAEAQKSFFGLFSGFPFHAVNMMRGEPALLIFLALGMMATIRRRCRWACVSWIFITVYFIAFYLFFLHVDRFLLMLYPLLCLFAAEGFIATADALRGRIKIVTMVLPFLVMLAVVIRYDALLLKNDTRIIATRWAEKNIPSDAKIMVLAPIMRLPATSDAIAEQESIDAASLRSVDTAERSFADEFFRTPRYHALNLNSVRNVDFLANIEEYIRSHDYEFVMYEPMLTAERVGDAFEAGETIAEFRGYNELRGDAIVNGFGDGWKQVFTAPAIGPDIIIKKIKILNS